jgi:hypothetical protein
MYEEPKETKKNTLDVKKRFGEEIGEEKKNCFSKSIFLANLKN